MQSVSYQKNSKKLKFVKGFQFPSLKKRKKFFFVTKFGKITELLVLFVYSKFEPQTRESNRETMKRYWLTSPPYTLYRLLLEAVIFIVYAS